jgi:hypothetical protein
MITHSCIRDLTPVGTVGKAPASPRLVPLFPASSKMRTVIIADQTMKPKKRDHTSITGKKFHGTDAEFYLASRLPHSRVTLDDRREVLMNALGEPLWARGPGLPPVEMDPRERVTASAVLWMDIVYSDFHRHHEKRTIAKQWLEDFTNGLQPSIAPIVGERDRKRTARA